MRTRWVTAGAAIVVAACGAGWIVAGAPLPFGSDPDGSPAEASGTDAIPVHVATATTHDVPVAFDYTGTAKSPEIVELKARVTGMILKRPFQPGTFVHRGDLLFQIDERPFAAALAGDTAQEAAAEADRSFYAVEVDRYTRLNDKGFASQERMQQAIRNRDTAAARINDAQSRIMTDRLDVEYARVEAPFTGQAGITDVNVGDVVTANRSNLVGLAALDPIDVQIAISSDDLHAVREAMAAGRHPVFQILGPDGNPDGRVAEIREFDDRADPSTGRLLVRARMPNPKHDVAPGDFLRVRLRVGTETRLLVPTLSLSSELDQQIVFVVSDGEAKAVQVRTGEVFGNDTAILSGLSAGAVVATDNVMKLNSGAKVTVRHGTDASSPSSSSG